MKIYTQMSIRDFKAWSDGKSTLDLIIEHDQCEEFEGMIAEYFEGEIIEDTVINDFLFFERDEILNYLNIEC